MTEIAVSSNPSGARSFSLALRDIKLAHSVFALPFALLGGALAVPAGAPVARTAGQAALIVVCMVAARTVAMLVNRVADRRFDAANPRTAGRAVASGALAVRAAGWMIAASAAVFVLGCAGFVFFGNWWPVALSAPTLGLVSFYSFTKRFTSLAHVFLGLALAASPVAAAIAVAPGSVGLDGAGVTASGAATLLLAGFVALWVAGFDVLYALQDLEFDRGAGLRSIPAALGARGAAWASRGLHVGAFVLLVLAVRTEPRLGALMYGAVAVVGAALIAEHWVLVRRGLAGLPMAFFTLNGVVSVVVGCVGVCDLVV